MLPVLQHREIGDRDRENGQLDEQEKDEQQQNEQKEYNDSDDAEEDNDDNIAAVGTVGRPLGVGDKKIEQRRKQQQQNLRDGNREDGLEDLVFRDGDGDSNF